MEWEDIDVDDLPLAELPIDFFLTGYSPALPELPIPDAFLKAPLGIPDVFLKAFEEGESDG